MSNATEPSSASPPPRREPWVQLKYFSFKPTIYPAMIKEVSRGAKAGDLVAVYDKFGEPFGTGLYNPRARVPLRVIHHGAEPVGEDHFVTLLDRAIDLRLDVLRLRETTDAFRVVHSDGDSLSGLVVDVYGDVLSVEVHSLGVFQRLEPWLEHLHRRLGTKRAVVEVEPEIARIERIPFREQPNPPRMVRIREHGVRYEVDFEAGHKTGFFCDQRENRRRFARFTAGKRVLDLCCYSGGFALTAKVLGQADETTGVDLDEKALVQARRNMNLNNARIEWVRCDAFAYARQMQKNGRRWDAVVLDPPKLITSREEAALGWRKYEDLNGLGTLLVEPGGLLVTCSCSGLASAEEFEDMVVKAAHRVQRRLQILDRTGAGEDHPVMSNSPESRYLKVIWARVW